VDEKGACMHVSTSTLKFVSETSDYGRNVVKNYVYLEGFAESPLYRRGER